MMSISVPPVYMNLMRNLYMRAKELVGDRDPRAHRLSVQLQAMDVDNSR